MPKIKNNSTTNQHYVVTNTAGQVVNLGPGDEADVYVYPPEDSDLDVVTDAPVWTRLVSRTEVNLDTPGEHAPDPAIDGFTVHQRRGGPGDPKGVHRDICERIRGRPGPVQRSGGRRDIDSRHRPVRRYVGRRERHIYPIEKKETHHGKNTNHPSNRCRNIRQH